MNYNTIYNELITFRKNNPPNGYSENHHIIPRSLGGSDDPNNLVRLTAREHYIAHLILVKIYENTQNYFKMLNALIIMKASNNEKRTTSRLYELYKQKYITEFKIKQSGSGNNQFGSIWIYNPETREASKTFGDIPEGWLRGKTDKKYYKICKICNQDFVSESKKQQICSKKCRDLQRSLNDTLLGKEQDFIIEYDKTKSINQALRNVGSKSGGAGRHYYWAKTVLENRQKEYII